MNKFRILVVAASIFFGSALTITADAPPPTCCSEAAQTAGHSSIWQMLKILFGLN